MSTTVATRVGIDEVSRDVIDGSARDLLVELAAPFSLHDLYDQVGASMYDAVTAGDRSEIAELVRFLRNVEGDVLELASGSGRIAIPLVLAGHRVTALDASVAMNSLLRERVAALPGSAAERLTVVTDDMTTFELDREFAAIVLGTTSVSLLSERQRHVMFCRARDHLGPDGVFLLTVAADEMNSELCDLSVSVDVDGAVIHLFSRSRPGDSFRRVVGVCVDRDGQVAVATSQPRLLDADRLTVEARRAGFEPTAALPVNGPGGTAEQILAFRNDASTRSVVST